MDIGCQRPVSFSFLLIAAVSYEYPADDYQPQNNEDVNGITFAARDCYNFVDLSLKIN